MKEAISTIYNLLGLIEIKGVQNIANLYKALGLLEQIYAQLENEENKKEQEE